MKIRFDTQIITYRLSPEESDKLKTQKYLCARTYVPQGKFHYKIRLETEKAEFILGENSAELNIPYADFEAYKPNKQGLRYDFETEHGLVTLIVEIDLKKLRGKHS